MSLITEIQGFHTNVTKINENTFVKLKLKNIIIKDNVNDQRFPHIFSTSDGKDLVDICVTVYGDRGAEIEKDVRIVLGNIDFTIKPKVFFQLKDFFGLSAVKKAK